ncbi:MAG: dephospho-CoA kinase [Halieaceae bacterium]|jgi:dephospho-CoA kinase
MMKVVGLTGGIGSGKSTVAKIFTTLGIPVYDSDTRAKQLYSENRELREKMKAHFGEEIYIGTQVNKAKLAEIVFQNKIELAFLNELVHPLLVQDFIYWKIKQSSSYVVREAAILIESGGYTDCHAIVIVTAPADLRIQRVMSRDGVEEKWVESRMKNQLSDKERLKFSDFEIVNDGHSSLIEQVVTFHAGFSK